jgi:hypothetical protein
MGTLPRQQSRADRLRDYAAAMELARGQVAAMGILVRAREARATDQPLELRFAATEVDGRALPAAVWVGLRREGVDAALAAMNAVSQTHFLIEAREEIGQGYRLQTVEETRPLPEVDLLLFQLARLLDIPADVLNVLAEWGAEDPRLAIEIEELLDSRFGSPTRAMHAVPAPPEPGEQVPPRELGRLVMTVAEAATVLRLDENQAQALATLVRCADVTLTS